MVTYVVRLSLLAWVFIGIASATSRPALGQAASARAPLACGVLDLDHICSPVIESSASAPPLDPSLALLPTTGSALRTAPIMRYFALRRGLHSSVGAGAIDTSVAQARRHTVRGTVIGVVVGAAFGSIASATAKLSANCPPEQCPCGPGRAANTTCGTVFYGFLGGVVGAIIGYNIQTK